MGLVPEWLQGVIHTMQERADAKYAEELKNYNSAAQDWITANVINRDNGLAVTQFTRPVPARVVFSTDENGNLTQTSETDPKIVPPVLPPPVPKHAATPLRTSAPYADAANQAVMGQILQIVAETSAAVDRIVAKFGA